MANKANTENRIDKNNDDGSEKKAHVSLPIIKILISIVVVLCVCVGSAFWFVKSSFEQPLLNEKGELLVVDKGQTLTKVCRSLQQQVWVEDCIGLKVMAKLDKNLSKIKSGTYFIPRGLTLNGFVDLLNNGRVHQFAFTIVEGENMYQVMTKLNKAGFLVDDISSKTAAEQVKIFEVSGDTIEGYLAPDTYYVTDQTKASALLKRAISKQQERLNKAWENRSRLIPLKTRYELLKLASIVEKESSMESERSKIASVFYNRIEKRMRLQTDPTVIYGVWHEYQGDIKRSHLNQKTPFNTYRINGLPPTPIANPSLNSLLATADPEQTDYLYFVASGKGGHVFSKTLAEHNKAYKNYIKITNSND